MHAIVSSSTNNNNKTSHMDRLPNEILSKIMYQILISSNFIVGLTTDVTFTINCAMMVNTRFRDLTQRLPFQILPRIFFCSGGVAGNVGVKKLIRMFEPSRGVLEQRITWSQIKNGWGVTGTVLYRSLMVYHHGHIFAKQVANFKAIGRDSSIFSYYWVKELMATKGEKCLVTAYLEDGTQWA